MGSIIAEVFSVIAFKTSNLFAWYVFKSTSTKTGFNFNCIIGATVVENPQAAVITSEFSGKFKHARESKQAELPEFTNNPYFFPKILDTFFSNSIDLLPNPANHPSLRQSPTAVISSSP